MIYLNINIPSASALFAVFLFIFFVPVGELRVFVCVSSVSGCRGYCPLRAWRARTCPTRVAVSCARSTRQWRQDKKHDPHCCADNESQSQRPMFLTVGGAKWWLSGKKPPPKKTFFFVASRFFAPRTPAHFAWNINLYCYHYQRPCFSLFYIPLFSTQPHK